MSESTVILLVGALLFVVSRTKSDVPPITPVSPQAENPGETPTFNLSGQGAMIPPTQLGPTSATPTPQAIAAPVAPTSAAIFVAQSPVIHTPQVLPPPPNTVAVNPYTGIASPTGRKMDAQYMPLGNGVYYDMLTRQKFIPSAAAGWTPNAANIVP